jgi:proteasome lid subunit RPN8/RPN11
MPDPPSDSMPQANAGDDAGSAEGLPVRIEYALPVLEEICAIAVDGLYQFRHGGMEVGGVLFGAADSGLTSITAFRPLDCEHAFGPRFVLSERDRAAMKQLVDLPKSDPALAGLVPVGWYHSHTRSQLALSPRDLEIYHRLFPEPGQVALVLQPESYTLVRAGFFARGPDGTVSTAAYYEEFAVRPGRNGGQAAEPVQEAAPVPRSRAASIEPAPAEARAAARPEQAAETEPDLQPFPSFAHLEPGRSRKWLWPVAAIVLALGGGASVEAYLRYITPQEPLRLWVSDMGGQLLIDWDRASKTIREARSARIEILDGNEHRDIEMEGDRLREGSLDYVRNAEIVDVRLIVNPQSGKPAQEFIRFVGQPVRRPSAAVESEAIRQRDELQAELDKLRAEIHNRRDARARRAKNAAKPLPKP